MIKPLPILLKGLLFFVLFYISYNCSSQCPPFNATATPSFQAICSGSPITPIVLSTSQQGTTFSWTRNNTTSVTGIPASGSGNISGTLTNTTNAPVTTTFTITPIANSCTGISIIASVLVKPTIIVNTVPNQTICHGGATLPVNFNSPTTGGTITYNWTNSNTAIGLAGNGTGNIPLFTATNASNAPISGTVTVTPTFNSTSSSYFINPNPIIIPSSGAASLYPSIINVSGLPVNARLIGVGLSNIIHTAPGEINILLRSPSGQSVILMSDAGGSNSISGPNIILADAAAVTLSANGPIVSGTFQCTNYVGLTEPDQWPAPGPGAVTQPNPSLGLFSGSNPNGQWSLFVFDQANGNSGAIDGGWMLIFDQAGASTCIGTPTTFTYTVNPLPTVSIISDIPPPIQPGQVMTLTAVVAPTGGTFVWFKDGVLIPGATSNTLTGITVADLGNYTVTYTDPNGCVNTSAAFNVYAKPSSNFYVYPNPNNGRFSVMFYDEVKEEVTITVYDNLGSIVYRKKILTESQLYNIIDVDMSMQFSPQNYFVEIRNSKGQRIGNKHISIIRGQ